MLKKKHIIFCSWREDIWKFFEAPLIFSFWRLFCVFWYGFSRNKRKKYLLIWQFFFELRILVFQLLAFSHQLIVRGFLNLLGLEVRIERVKIEGIGVFRKELKIGWLPVEIAIHFYLIINNILNFCHLYPIVTILFTVSFYNYFTFSLLISYSHFLLHRVSNLITVEVSQIN